MKQLKIRTILSMVVVLKCFLVTTLVVTNMAEFVYTLKKIFLSNVEKTLKSYKKNPKKTVICEISLGRKIVFFVALYRSPNQSNEDFEEFYHKLQDR